MQFVRGILVIAAALGLCAWFLPSIASRKSFGTLLFLGLFVMLLLVYGFREAFKRPNGSDSGSKEPQR